MEKLSCDTCNKKFKNEDALKQHKNDAHRQAATTEVRKGGISKKKAYTTSILLLIFGIMGYGLFWALTAETMGRIGSAHIHADFSIFVNGEAITPLPQQFFKLSPYIAVEEGPGAGSVLHMHATNVPLKIFFRGMSMSLNDNCFVVSNQNRYCNDGTNTLKMFVKHVNGTWEQNFEYGKYVFQNLDKILITYGNENDDVQLQQGNVTDFAKDNSVTVVRK